MYIYDYVLNFKDTHIEDVLARCSCGPPQRPGILPRRRSTSTPFRSSTRMRSTARTSATTPRAGSCTSPLKRTPLAPASSTLTPLNPCLSASLFPDSVLNNIYLIRIINILSGKKRNMFDNLLVMTQNHFIVKVFEPLLRTDGLRPHPEHVELHGPTRSLLHYRVRRPSMPRYEVIRHLELHIM